MQLSTDPPMRGTVMALRAGMALGGNTPIGAPIVGWVANRFGPRYALGIGAATGLSAALVTSQRAGSPTNRSRCLLSN
jgi:MFS family permease